MANREALRQLQTRLAERMQAAQTEARATSWLAVECAGRGLLLPLHEAGEIFPMTALVDVPHTQPWFAGVANLRGALHGVVDLARFLGLRGKAERPDLVSDQVRLLALAPNLGVNCALMVDRMAGLRSAPQLTPLHDSAAQRPAFATALWRDDSGREWQEIALSTLALDTRFLSIAA